MENDGGLVKELKEEKNVPVIKPSRKSKRESVKIETPQSAQRRTQVEQLKLAKKGNEKVKVWYECRNDKVVECTRKLNGNSYRVFKYNRKKHPETHVLFLKELEKKGLELKIL